jgi:hypothetical protein
MTDNFDVRKWVKDTLIKEIEAEGEINLDINTVKKMHSFLSKTLDKIAIEKGDRMSYFSAEYPTPLSLYYDLKQNLK